MVAKVFSRVRGFLVTAGVSVLVLSSISAQADEAYQHYFGNTHSHGYSSDGRLATPADHFSLAKASGYDFYAVTDHALAKYPQFTAESYELTKREADRFTDDKFVAITGFEFSENDGPDGKGHLTALNTTGYLDATGKSVNLPTFYDWMITSQTTTTAASFNHAATDTYNAYDYLTPARRDGVTMFEMINSGKPRYEGYITALEKGWRVAPIGALDAHGTTRITQQFYRTGVLAPSLTREDIMQAMRARRVYCTWDRNLRLTFRANGRIMGSVLTKPTRLSFQIRVSDPDTRDAGDRITRIEIAGDNGALITAKDFKAHTVTWNPTFSPGHRYYFLKVYTADKPDAPTAYSSPVWVE